MEDIKLAKARLYGLLLNIDPRDLTEAEVNEMYELSKDEDIKEIIRNSMKNGR